MASQLPHGGNDRSPNSEIVESSVCSEHELQLPSSQDRSWRIANDSANSWLRSSFPFSNVNLTMSPAQPQSSPSKICIEHGFDSETESSSTIPAPPPIHPPQPLMPDTKWRRLRAAAALSRERARALPASSPVVSTSPASAVYKSPPFDLSPSTQPFKPWSVRHASEDDSNEFRRPIFTANALRHPPQTSQLTPTASCFRNHPRRCMMRHQAGKAASSILPIFNSRLRIVR